jgi:hypothetical protein
MELTQKLKSISFHAGSLTSLGLIASLVAGSIATAHPVKYRDTQVNPILLVAAADDFRAPPTKFGIQITQSTPAITDDFRAPPSDLIQTGSTETPKNCSRVRYMSCRIRH